MHLDLPIIFLQFLIREHLTFLYGDVCVSRYVRLNRIVCIRKGLLL